MKTQDGLLQTIEYKLRSIGPRLVQLLAPNATPGGIEEAYGGDGCSRVHLAKHHPDPQTDDMLCRPAVVPLLTTRYLYWGWVGLGCQGS